MGCLALVFLDGVADVKRLAGVDVGEVGGRVEGDAVVDFARGVVDHFEFDVLALLANEFAGAEVLDTEGAEHRFGVARSVGVELAQQREKLGRYLAECQIGVDVVLGRELVGAYVGPDIFLKPACELGDVFFLEREAYRIGVSAEVFEQVAGRLDCTVDVKTLHRTARSGGQTVGMGEHYGRLVVELGETRCHDADDAFVPVFVVDDYRLFLRMAYVALFEYGVGFFGYLLVKLLAVLVVSVDLFGSCQGVGHVAAHEQVDGLFAALHTSRGVDARPDLEYYIADGNLLARESAGAYDGAQAHVGVGVEAFETIVGEYPVLTDHRHDVGGD